MKTVHFFSWKPFAIKHSHLLNFVNMYFSFNNFIQYSLFGLVKYKFTNRIDIWCRVFRLEVNRCPKREEQTSLNCRFKYLCKRKKPQKSSMQIDIRDHINYIPNFMTKDRNRFYLDDLYNHAKKSDPMMNWTHAIFDVMIWIII